MKMILVRPGLEKPKEADTVFAARLTIQTESAGPKTRVSRLESDFFTGIIHSDRQGFAGTGLGSMLTRQSY